ncbi:hypothetical protein B0H13DRAFT_1532139, partial [Mycena leptocephala]
FVGTIINWTLLGSLVVQVYLYFVAFPEDPRFTEVLVAVVFLAELPQTFADGHDSLKSLVGAGWGNLAALDEVNWAWFSVPVLGSTIASVGQMFFAWRLYIIAQNLFVPGRIG